MTIFRTILASTLCFGTAVSADTISFEDFGDGLVFEVDQFDPTLGTLNSVALRFSSELGSTTEGRFFAFGEAIFLELVSFIEIEVNGETDSIGAFDRVDEGICMDASGCLAFAETPDLPVVIFQDLESPFNDLSPFIGTGSIVGNVAFDGLESRYLGANLSVTYDFDASIAAVPLPASAGFLLAGLGALGVWGRRRKA